MSSDTDSKSSSSVSSSANERKHRLHSKLKKVCKSKKKSIKHKRQKKKIKRIKDKKGSHKESTAFSNKNIITQEVEISPSETFLKTHDDGDIFGPVLPPHLIKMDGKDGKSQPTVIGPIIPQEILKSKDTLNLESQEISPLEAQSSRSSECESKDLQDCYGPLPMSNESGMTTAQFKLEQRALELKIAGMEGSIATNDQHTREEWMLELPNVGLKTGLAALSNLKRSFYQGKEKPDFSDRSSWTKTPQSDSDKRTPKSSKMQLEQQAQSLYEKQRDAEQEAIAKKHKNKRKRKESLVELHQKKLRKAEKKKAKKLKESGDKPERRPFSRDVDLKLNKIDRNQTKQIVDKAKILNTKFAAGHLKYL